MRITLPSGTPAELAEPAGDPTRGLVLIPDIMGLRPLFDDHCARLASEHGWRVVAVEPFPGEESMTLDERREHGMATRDDNRLLSDLLAAADRLGTDRVGVIGFCMGGMYTFKAAGTGRFDRAVSFYGMVRVPESFRGPKQGEPLDYLHRPEACPVLAILGGRDPFTPREDIELLGTLPNVEIAFYPDAQHGFVHDPSREAHRPHDAADAWQRAAAFLA